MEKVKLREGIYYVIPGKTPIHMTSAGLILQGRLTCFVDVSMENNLSVELVKELKPDILMVSHYHLDHSIWLRRVERENAEVWIPEGEEGYFTDIEHFLNGTVGERSQFREAFKNLLLGFLGWEKVEPLRAYCEEKINFGDFSLQIIRAPGHSPGHSVFYIPEEKVLFCADIGLGKYGPWYGWVDSDLILYAESVRKLMDVNANVLLSSHDGIFKNPEEALREVLKAFFEREKMIARAMEEGKSREDIVQQGIYFKNKHKVPEPQQTFITVQDEIMLDHHIAVLKGGGLEKILGWKV